MQEPVHVDSPQPSRTRPRGALLPIAVAATFVLAACSGSGGDIGAPPDAANDGTVESTDPGPNFVPNADGSGEAPGATDVGPETAPTTPSIAPIPDTGVPGIDSSDAFCRAWSQFAGSFQAVGLVSAIGDSDDAYRLEVIAASSVTTAVEAMEANLPAELDAERVALIAEFAGPFMSRAAVAEAELQRVGIEPDSLRDFWLTTLAEAGVDDPALSVDVPVEIDADALDEAVASFSSLQLPIVEDPSLVTDASIPATEEYLAASCPDGGVLAGNDVVGDNGDVTDDVSE